MGPVQGCYQIIRSVLVHQKDHWVRELATQTREQEPQTQYWEPVLIVQTMNYQSSAQIHLMEPALLQMLGQESIQKDRHQSSQRHLLVQEYYQINQRQLGQEPVLQILQSLLGQVMQYHDYPVSSLQSVVLHDFDLYMHPLPICFED
jgi:hypothetical protein